MLRSSKAVWKPFYDNLLSALGMMTKIQDKMEFGAGMITRVGKKIGGQEL